MSFVINVRRTNVDATNPVKSDSVAIGVPPTWCHRTTQLLHAMTGVNNGGFLGEKPRSWLDGCNNARRPRSDEIAPSRFDPPNPGLWSSKTSRRLYAAARNSKSEAVFGSTVHCATGLPVTGSRRQLKRSLGRAGLVSRGLASTAGRRSCISVLPFRNPAWRWYRCWTASRIPRAVS